MQFSNRSFSLMDLITLTTTVRMTVLMIIMLAVNIFYLTRKCFFLRNFPSSEQNKLLQVRCYVILLNWSRLLMFMCS